jgi:hypothetical protein
MCEEEKTLNPYPNSPLWSVSVLNKQTREEMWTAGVQAPNQLLAVERLNQILESDRVVAVAR